MDERSGLGRRRLTVVLPYDDQTKPLTAFNLSRRAPVVAATALVLPLAAKADSVPLQGGTLIYLDQQAHTALYPPTGRLYPNSGVLNQITDKLT